ncbi:hypothetical protein ACQEVM_05070 [Streptomyces sp. CA-243310]|uniref:hypothetical protein n=1 Tax=Streptomyces sp. CA-243310 TaxID=3240056 RepID=UPI003D8F8451
MVFHRRDAAVRGARHRTTYEARTRVPVRVEGLGGLGEHQWGLGPVVEVAPRAGRDFDDGD